MTIAISTLFLLTCIGLGIWMKRDSSFRKREFAVVSVFWILLVGTPVGADAVNKIQEMIGNGAQSATDTVNSVSNR